MKVIGINGSPRKGWNTDLLVRAALDGAASKGVETEIVHLYDVRFRSAAVRAALPARKKTAAV